MPRIPCLWFNALSWLHRLWPTLRCQAAVVVQVRAARLMRLRCLIRRSQTLGLRPAGGLSPLPYRSPPPAAAV